MSNQYHWNLSADGKTITAYASSGDHHTPIANVEIERSVRQLLRTSQLGEDVENLFDHIAAGSMDAGEFLIAMRFLMKTYLDDTMTREYGKKVPCPQLEKEVE